MTDKKAELITVEILHTKTETLPEEDTGPVVGQWYWVKDEVDEDEPESKDAWFGCVVHLGSNYVLMESRWEGSIRIHFNEFDQRCKLEPNSDEYIDAQTLKTQALVNQLMGKVKEVTARLGVAPSPMLAVGASETQALAKVNTGMDINTYGADLVKAKEKTLPDLFKEIGKANKSLAAWMTAKVIPLKAQANGLHGVIGRIDDRIFNVSLYAGLTEDVERIKDGEPAPLDAKVHLLQRLCFMDEECLAHYEVGGMEFADLGGFDDWLTRPDNLERLLPFPRCVVSFRVRRNRKQRVCANIGDYFRIVAEEDADKLTFLYIRNGERVYRMNTELEFDGRLFPDLDKGMLASGKLWARDCGQGRGKGGIISDNEYQGMKEDYERESKEFEVEWAAYEAAKKTPDAKARAKAKGFKEPDGSCVDLPWPGSAPHIEHTRYSRYTPENLYFDDITKVIQDDLKKHNRVALILQGLLDRSPVLHPHPPWQIWTSEGFEQALELVYDSTRALVAGDKPDFEAYRKRLNAKLTKGSLTVGQEDAWELHEGEKESEKRRRNFNGGDYYPERCRPHGNPGPGMIAQVTSIGRKAKTCTYSWMRERVDWRRQDEEGIRTSFTCPQEETLLNVSAYKPGDFKQFFDDPRTRAEYLQWAPLLLEAEEFHAGNRKIVEPAKPTPKKPSSYEGRMRYQRTKYRKSVMGKAVRLTCDIKMRSKKVFEKGTLWRITGGQGSEFGVTGLDDDGNLDWKRAISNISKGDFEVDESIERSDKFD